MKSFSPKPQKRTRFPSLNTKPKEKSPLTLESLPPKSARQKNQNLNYQKRQQRKNLFIRKDDLERKRGVIWY